MLHSASAGLLRISARALLFCLILAPFCRAQLSTTGTITGTVTDETGSVVPNAEVKVTNLGTQVRTEAQTNAVGTYTITGLPVGTYSVTIAKQGFQGFTASNLYLGPAAVRTVNVSLKVGGLTTEVTVTASSVQVQTETSEVSSHVSEQQVSTLPLNGRNYQALAALMPGVINAQAGFAMLPIQQVNQMSISGMGITGTMVTTDGAMSINHANLFGLSVVPNPDTVQEVRVLQNNYSVKYSTLGTNAVLIQTRSGTQEFHGQVFEYFRNDKLNTRNFFATRISPFKQNIFGYTVGGPVYIPGHYNANKQKTFFFWSEQWTVRHVASVVRGATATAEMRQGIFNNSIKDPTTGNPFPQNSAGQFVIPSNRINPNSLALMNALAPLPNNPAGGFLNYINNEPSIIDGRNDSVKIDHNFSQKVRLMAQWLRQGSDSTTSSGGGFLGSPFNTVKTIIDQPNQVAQLQLTVTIAPTMVNQTSVSMNRFINNLNVSGKVFLKDVPDFHSTKPFNGFLSDRLPAITFARGWSPFGVSRHFPLRGADDLDNTVADDWSWLQGNHFLQAGFNLIKLTKRQNAFAASQGEWFFNGQLTGDPIADYLLGDAFSFFQESTERRPYLHGTQLSPYFEDRWKVNRRLTLNLGIRWNLIPLPNPQPGFITIFDPKKYDPSKAPIVNANGTITPTPNFDPLNGLIRNGANGLPLNFSTEHQWYWLPSVGFAWDVFGDGKTSLRGGYGISRVRMFGGNDCTYFCGSQYPDVQSLTLIFPSFPSPTGGLVPPPGAPTLRSQDLELQAGQIQSFSLSLERQYGNWIFSIAGAGTIGRHVGTFRDRNQPSRSGSFDFDPSINAGTYPYKFAPFQGYGAIVFDTSNGNIYWDALLFNARHPVGRNLFLTVAYTWSHNLSDQGGQILFQGQPAFVPQDSYHPGTDYGNAALDARHVLAVSHVWTLPWYQTASGWRGAVLGGWKYAGITTIQSGFALDPGLSIAQQGIAKRPNLVGPVSGPKTVTQWFNTSAFAKPALGFFGNAGRGIIRGPGLLNFDMAFYKDFRITERHKIEFRSEFFNIFNHPNFRGVATALGSPIFGRVISAADPRIIEFALRYEF